MNKEKNLSALEQVLVDTLKSVNETGSEIYAGGKEFSLEAINIAQQQIPDIINQLLIWKLVESIFILIISVVIIIICICLGKKFHKACDGFVWVLMAAAIALPTVIAIARGLEILKILLAPKIYLIEYVKHLM